MALNTTSSTSSSASLISVPVAAGDESGVPAPKRLLPVFYCSGALGKRHPAVPTLWRSRHPRGAALGGVGLLGLVFGLVGCADGPVDGEDQVIHTACFGQAEIGAVRPAAGDGRVIHRRHKEDHGDLLRH